MGSKPDWRTIGFTMTAAERIAREAERRQCAEVIDAWNERARVRRDPDPSPSIGVALAAGYPWLQVYCPGCRQASQVDLRTINRHPAASLSSLIPALSCRRCTGGAPFAKLQGASMVYLAPRWRKVPI
ncbi:MAG TPA: hypothetical protein VK522_18295 [Pseudolabrys sp.]|nr:hypothetical protein [Pseudolabrys sp.]